MRIAVFTDSYLPTVDGVVTSLLTTKRELERLGHEVIVFAPQVPGDGRGRVKDVVWIPAREFRAYPGYRIAMFPSHELEFIMEIQPDIIHTHGIGFMGVKGMWSASQSKRPLVLTFHTMVIDALTYYTPFQLKLSLLERGLRLYLRVFLHRCRAVVVPSHAILREIEALAPRMRFTDVIPTGVDTQRFRPDVDGASVRERWGIGDGELVLHVGRIAREKNLPMLVCAFEQLRATRPGSKLMFVGQGPYVEGLRSYVHRKGLQDAVVFAGFVPDEELPAYYAACDAFAIPSKFETQALVVLEAMASGKPVAGANFRAIPEFVHDGENGYLFEPGDVKGAAGAISRCLDDRDRMSHSARATAERYTIASCAERLLAVYRRLLAR